VAGAGPRRPPGRRARHLAEGTAEQHLTPAVVQGRALGTVGRLIDAAVELLDAGEEQDVTIAAITRRAEVTTGSLYHHFGDRNGLVATAHARRFDRLLERQLQLLAPLFEGETAVECLAVADELLAAVAAGAQHDDRRIRVSALAATRHRPVLNAGVRASLRGSIDTLADRIVAAQARGVVVPTLPPRALAVFTQTIGLGMLADAITGDAQPVEHWEAVFRTVTHGLFVHDCAAACRPTGIQGAAATARAVGDREGPKVLRRPARDWRWSATEEDEQAVLRAVAERLRAGGPDAVVAQEVREEVGVSSTWFHRRFGDRQQLIDLTRIEAMRTAASREIAAVEAAVDLAVDVASRASTLEAGRTVFLRAMVDASGDAMHPKVLDRNRDRLDLIASVLGRKEVSLLLGELVVGTTGSLAHTFARAQDLTLVRDDLPPLVLARFLWGYPMGIVVGEMAGITVEEWTGLAHGVLGALIGAGPTPS
jgi:AcrR family transcriptional regulator